MAGTNGTIDGATSLSQRLLTLPEAAHYLGCTLWSVRELIWKGDLPYTRFGKRFQVDRRDLDELVDREKRCQRGQPIHWTHDAKPQGSGQILGCEHGAHAQSERRI